MTNDAPDLNTVIERLKTRRNYYNAMMENGNADQEAWYRQSVAEMTDALSHLKAMQWVSVEERLPEPWAEVWFSFEGDVWVGQMTDEERFRSYVTDGYNDPVVDGGQEQVEWFIEVKLPPLPGDQT